MCSKFREIKFFKALSKSNAHDGGKQGFKFKLPNYNRTALLPSSFSIHVSFSWSYFHEAYLRGQGGLSLDCLKVFRLCMGHICRGY